MMRALLAALVLLASACRCGDSSAKKDANMVGDTTRSNWPAAPAPNLPPELADLAWPPSLAELERRFPALATPEGLRLGDVAVRLVQQPAPLVSSLWLHRPTLDLGALDSAWGSLVRDRSGHAVWFNPAARIKARYPAKQAGLEGVELSYYVSTLDRIASAPEQLAPGGGPLVGAPVSALDAYAPWIASRDAELAILELPPGEWDPGSMTMTASIKDGAIWRIKLRIHADAPPVDAAAVRARLEQRWGAPEVTQDAGRPAWRYPKGVLLRDLGHLEITYSK